MSDHIKRHWDEQAKEHGRSADASWGDHHAIELEVETIGGYIHEGDRVLDVGCANGHATLAQLGRGPAALVGVDYSEEMVRQARSAWAAAGRPEGVSFAVGDVRRLEFEDASFDVVYTTRVLINLPTWSEQRDGIRECLRVCAPGGRVVLSEAFWEPLMRLNAIRALAGLPPLVEHDFNRYLKQEALERFLEETGVAYEHRDFCSIYYLGSRFLRELVTNPADYPGYTNPVNGIFCDIEKRFDGGGFGVQQAYVLRR